MYSVSDIFLQVLETAQYYTLCLWFDQSLYQSETISQQCQLRQTNAIG